MQSFGNYTFNHWQVHISQGWLMLFLVTKIQKTLTNPRETSTIFLDVDNHAQAAVQRQFVAPLELVLGVGKGFFVHVHAVLRMVARSSIPHLRHGYMGG